MRKEKMRGEEKEEERERRRDKEKKQGKEIREKTLQQKSKK